MKTKSFICLQCSKSFKIPVENRSPRFCKPCIKIRYKEQQARGNKKSTEKRLLASNSECSVDLYPRVDKYIPEACIIADRKIKNRRTNQWTHAFLSSMDGILFEKGLRVL